MIPAGEMVELESLLQKVGEDFDLTQGLGGNISFKNDEAIWVKASGKRLSAYASEGFYYKVRRTPGHFVDDLPGQVGKPSIEVFMHAFSEQRYVIHLHSAKAVALGMLASKSKAAKTAANSFSALMPYARPGEDLRKLLSSELTNDFEGTVLLANHGVLHVGNTVSELEETIFRFEESAGEILNWRDRLPFSPNDLSKAFTERERRGILWHSKVNWRISPDHCVFLGPIASSGLLGSLERAETPAELLPQSEVEDRHLSVSSEQLLWFFNVASLLPQEAFETIPESEAKDLSNWDAEKHRMKLARAVSRH
jgi:rhamnose utilization protein RhaD (predicted bifunctional aldolase and dehydrogenase)